MLSPQAQLPYDVFLSHHSGDKALVEQLAVRLEDEANLKPFLDKWHLVPGEPWQEELEAALNQSATCAVFLGANGLGAWENEEMRSALDERVRNPNFRVIPVLLPGAEPKDEKTLPRFLRRLTWVDFRTELEDPKAFHCLVAGIQGLPPGRHPVFLTSTKEQMYGGELPTKQETRLTSSSLNNLQHSKWKKLLLLFLTVTFITGSLIWSYQSNQLRDGKKSSIADQKKVTVLVARFDGKQEDEQRVTTHILEAVKNATKGINGVEIRPLGEVITAEQGSEKAREKAREQNAELILWGWYDSDLIGAVHIEPLLSPILDGSLVEGQRKFSAINEGGNIAVKQRLSEELSYLTLLLVGLLRTETGFYDEAVKIFDKSLTYSALKNVVNPSTLYFYRAIAFQEQDKPDEAIADFSQAIKINPEYAAAYFNRAQNYQKHNKPNEAIADYTQAIKFKPEYAFGYNNRGNTYRDKGKFDEAIADYTQAIKLKPDYAVAHNNRASSYRGIGKVDEAIADYTQAVKLNPNYALAYYNRGNAYLSKGSFDEAISDYTQSLKYIEDVDAQNRKNIFPAVAESFTSKKGVDNDDNSVTSFNEVKMFSFQSYAIYSNRAIAYMSKGKDDEAIADCSQVIKLKPDDATAYHNRGEIYRRKDRLDEAIADYSQAIKLKPTGGTYFVRGEAYSSKGKPDEAIADYNQAIKLKPDDAIYLKRGAAYVKKGEIGRAKEDFRHFISITNNNKRRQLVTAHGFEVSRGIEVVQNGLAH